MVIVNVTRDDLRDEFPMADEAFALSPISARAAQPREEDYDAIREAFMETSRGRWFLGEYARRNRNADTSMVLDAVARIEDTIAAQQQPPPDSGLAEALAAIKQAVDEARTAAWVAINNLALEETLVPIRKGARVIREIAWRWREIGADGRICDLLDLQVNAIEASCGQIGSIDPSGALNAAFDLIEGQIAELNDGDTASPQEPEADVPSSSFSFTRLDETPAVDLETVHAVAEIPLEAEIVESPPEAAISTPATPTEAAVETVAIVATEAPAELAAEDLDARTPEALDAQSVDAESLEAESLDVEDLGADDDAVLDLVALEMAAPDPFESDVPLDAGADDIHATALAAAAPEIIASMPEPIAAPAQPPTIQPEPEPQAQPKPSLEASLGPTLEASLEALLEVSLGSALIANGILQKPHASATDALAPIRRMSQAEKIAFFS
jgi:hypothetical protein